MAASRDHNDERHSHPTIDPCPSVQATESHSAAQVSNIWIGYVKKRRSYIDMQSKAPNTEQQIRVLKDFYQQRFTPTERFILRWVYCQTAVVLIGELHAAAPNALEEQFFPQEVQFEKLEKSEMLSAGFWRAETLRENGRLFHDTSSFDVGTMDATSKRKVLCVGHAVDKRYLVWPLAFSFCVAVIAAVVAGTLTRSISSGAELGGFVGVAVVLLWSYILWLLG